MVSPLQQLVPSVAADANAAEPSHPALRVELLGGFSVSCDGRTVDDAQWRLSKARGLVKLLALSPGQQLHREQVIDYLWPDLAPDAAMNNLHQVLFAARRAIAGVVGEGAAPAQMIPMQRQILLLNPPGPLWIDALVFDARGEAALQSDDPANCYACIDLYVGDLLPEDRYEEWAEEPRERLRERYLAVLGHLARLHEERDEPAPAIDALRRLIAADPVQEDAHIRLMRLYALTGRSQQALRQYSRLRDILERELDALPSRDADRLNAAILDGRFPPAPAPAARVTAVAPPVPPAAAPAPASDFVNREHELAALRGGLERALAGRGAVVLLGGEAGIGKTRATEEFTRQARASGVRVRWGRCYDGEGSLAYWPWMQILRDDLGERDGAALASGMGARMADIARLVPDLRERLPGVPDPIPLDPDQERFRLFDSVAAYLAAASAADPLVLVFDDLHWADRSSLQLLEYLADEIREQRILLIGLYRDAGLDRHHPLTRTVNRLARHEAGERLHLAGLSVAHVGQVSELTSGRTPPLGLVEVIHGQTEGNPLFVREVVRLLLDEGRFDEPGDIHSWRVTIPRGVRETIALRLDRLSDAAIRVLEIAAVIGRDFNLAILQPVSGLAVDELLAALEEALAAGVLGESQSRPGTFRFGHALIQQTLYEDVSAARRVLLHERIGGALETAHAGDLSPVLADLAFHYLQAARGDDGAVTARAVEYGLLAGAQAMDQVAYADAIGHFERALRLLTDGEPSAPAARQRCDVLLRLGEAQAAAGDSAVAKETVHAAADLARGAALQPLLVRAAHGVAETMWSIGLPDATGFQLLEDAVAATTNDRVAARVQSIADLVRELATAPAQDATVQERATRLVAEAMEIADQLGDPRTRLTAAIARQWVVSANNEPTDRLENATAILALAREIGDRQFIMLAHAWRIYDLMELGEVAAAAAENDAYAALAEELRQPRPLWSLAARRAMHALVRGDLDTAERLIDEARALGRRSAPRQAEMAYLLQLAQLRHEQGRAADALPLAADIAERHPPGSHYDCVHVALLADAGQLAEARAGFERLAADSFGSVAHDLLWLPSLALLASICPAVGTEQHAGELQNLLLPYARGNISGGGNATCLGPATLFLGGLAAQRQHWDAAETHYRAAFELARQMESPLFMADAQTGLAAALLARDPQGERDATTRLLDLAIATATTHGLQRILAVATDLRRAGD
jgi:DNA-binding SARP family transcriptional activator